MNLILTDCVFVFQNVDAGRIFSYEKTMRFDEQLSYQKIDANCYNPKQDVSSMFHFEFSNAVGIFGPQQTYIWMQSASCKMPPTWYWLLAYFRILHFCDEALLTAHFEWMSMRSIRKFQFLHFVFNEQQWLFLCFFIIATWRIIPTSIL